MDGLILIIHNRSFLKVVKFFRGTHCFVEVKNGGIN